MAEYTEQEKELIKKHEEHRKSPNAICNDFTDNTPYLDIEKSVKVRATRNGQRYYFRAIAYQGCHFDGKRLDEAVSKALKKIKEFE